MSSNEMAVPKELLELTELGKWPGPEKKGLRGYNKTTAQQQFAPLISSERVRALAPDESLIILFPPPFHSLYVAEGTLDFFRGASDEAAPPGDLDFSKCLDIGDFGMGSDSPIVLDYRSSLQNPRVLRLRIHREGDQWNNRWVTIAPSFRDFAVLLGLLD